MLNSQLARMLQWQALQSLKLTIKGIVMIADRRFITPAAQEYVWRCHI